MADENVETFKRGVEAVNTGDVEAVVELADPQIYYEPRRAAMQGAYLGHEGLREFFRDTAENFDLFEVNMTEIRGVGDEVLGIGSLRVRGRGSGVETEVPAAVVARFRDGLMVHFKDHLEADKARAAVGLA